MPENATGAMSSTLSGTQQVHHKLPRSAPRPAAQSMRIPPKIPRWQRVTHPPGALAATLLIGLAGAVLIPLDRPGLGWFLAAAIAVGAIYAVDRNARKILAESPEPPVAAQIPNPAGAAVTSNRGGDGSTSVPQPTSTPTVSNDATIWANPATRAAPAPAPEPPSGDVPAAQDAPAHHDVPASGDHAAAADDSAIGDALVSGDDRASGDVPAAEDAPVRGPEPRLGDRAARMFWVAMVLVLPAVGVFRAAGWLFVCCLVGAGVAASLAVVGRRSANGAWFDVFAVPLLAVPGVQWLFAGVGRMRAGAARREWGVALSAVVTLGLLAVFVPLLGGADATFAALFDAVTPRVDGGLAFQWIFLFTVLGLAAAGALYLLAAPLLPASEGAGGLRVRQLRRIEWVLPVGALTVLFTVFVIAQFVALFGGDDYVQRTAGLTYAEYARTGFWQLSVVSILTLAVLLVVLRWADQATAGDRMWLRALLSAVAVLSLIIVASALGRMWTYQQAYGFTVLRLLVEVCELWLGLVYLLVLAAVLSLRRMWLVRTVLGTAMATVLALAVVNPERLIADQNIDRWQQGKPFDVGYLTVLSPDSLPAIDRLPEPMRTQVRESIHERMDSDSWNSWNRSRATAGR
ncbi:DUF4153 domain-containing protein [Nocardia brasiliensis]|uniref:DUF4153 domain-containing protein n=1 Tax=Nocardia brasiliensis TaxID=37326 RepID=UPI002458F828|nr:DUF4173 domain-containing protein [Nocardia brasiliensis]